MTMRVFVAVTLVSTMGLAAIEARAQTDAPAPERPPMVHAKALSLKEMAHDADRIFIGEVIDVKTGTETLRADGESFTGEIRTVTFRVEDVLKGNIDKKSTLSLKQYAPHSAPVQVGEELLWYVSPDSRFGLTQPLGFASGHFKIKKDPEDPRYRVAVSLNGNRDLFKEGSPEPSAVRNEAEQLQQPQWRVQALMRAAEEAARAPDAKGPVPIELLTTATKKEVEAAR